MPLPRFSKFSATTFLAIALLSFSARATVLLELAGGYLKDASGTAIAADSGLLVLVASTSDTSFSLLTDASSLTVGSALNSGTDDVVLFASSVSGDGYMDGTSEAGEFRQVISLTLSTTVAEGSALQLYWFPTLTTSSSSAAVGTAYGIYRSATADADGSWAWFLPADGTSGYELLFLTSDAGSQVNTSTSGTPFGTAIYTVAAVPEPATWPLLIAAASVVLLRAKRRLAA